MLCFHGSCSQSADAASRDIKDHMTGTQRSSCHRRTWGASSHTPVPSDTDKLIKYREKRRSDPDPVSEIKFNRTRVSLCSVYQCVFVSSRKWNCCRDLHNKKTHLFCWNVVIIACMKCINNICAVCTVDVWVVWPHHVISVTCLSPVRCFPEILTTTHIKLKLKNYVLFNII